jgi:hypothetical protein
LVAVGKAIDVVVVDDVVTTVDSGVLVLDDEVDVELLVAMLVDVEVVVAIVAEVEVVVAMVPEVEVVEGSVELDVELVDGVDAVVVVTVELEELVVVDVMHVQSWEQVEPGGQLKAPPGELGSQSSPGSTTPLLQSVEGVVVVVDVLVLEEVGLDVDDVVGTEVGGVDVEVDDDVVVGAPHATWVSVTRSVFTSLAKNAPRSDAPTVISSGAPGAQSVPVMAALRRMRTLLAAKTRTSHGPTEALAGPRLLPLSSLVAPSTVMETGPCARICAFRPRVRLQNT